MSPRSHTYGGLRTINGNAEDLRVPAKPRQRVRVRVSNTDNGPMKLWTSGPYRLLALDGAEVHQPTEISGRSVTLTAGARADVEAQVPSDGTAVRIQLSKATAVVIGPQGADTPVPPQPANELDLLSYGTPAPLGFDPAQATRRFDYRIGRRPGFVKGRPGMWWSSTAISTRMSRCMWYARATWRWCTSRTATGRCIPCTSTAITWSCWRATAWRHRKPLVGRLTQRPAQRDLRHRLRGQ